MSIPSLFRLPSPFAGEYADDYSKLLSVAETNLGKALLLSLFGLFLMLGNPGLDRAGCLIVLVATAACTFLPAYRLKILPAAALVLLFTNPFVAWFNADLAKLAAVEAGGPINFTAVRYVTLIVFVGLYVAVLMAALRFQRRGIFRRPVLALLTAFFFLLLVASSGALTGTPQVHLWSFITVFAALIWFFAYALQDTQSADPSPLYVHLGLLHPFWGSTNAPFGKGGRYIRKVMAETPRDLAVCQVQGIKLLFICGILRTVKSVFESVVFGWAHIPSFEKALAHQISGAPYAIGLCWVGLIAAYFQWILYISIMGNSIVGFARVAGFYLLRNTYKPLASTSIAEFFNRIYFYFKELMVDLFFYPAFFSCFRNHRRLRVAFATFMAAGIGNMIYHFVRDLDWVIKLGFWRAVVGYQTYAFQCVVLSGGIICSQLWPYKNRAPQNWLAGTLLPWFGVMMFYCFLHIFDDYDRTRTLGQHFAFLFHLFALA